MIEAGEALAIGLATRVVPVEQLDATVQQVAAELATRAVSTVQATKELMRRLRGYRIPTGAAEDVMAPPIHAADSPMAPAAEPIAPAAAPHSAASVDASPAAAERMPPPDAGTAVSAPSTPSAKPGKPRRAIVD